jgi:hypothetical protein
MRNASQGQQIQGPVSELEDPNENLWAMHVATGLLKFRSGEPELR